MPETCDPGIRFDVVVVAHNTAKWVASQRITLAIVVWTMDFRRRRIFESALYFYCHFYYANFIARTGMTNFMVGVNVQVLIRARQ